MKYPLFLYLTLVLLIGFTSCKESQADKRKRSIELMTTQTLGLAYLEEFKLEEAAIEFRKMIELAPEDKLGYANLGLVYLRMGNYKEAEEQIIKSLEKDPDDPDISLLLATVYQMEGRREEAIKVLQGALEKSPGHVKILYDLASMYSTENSNEALELQKRYLEELVTEAPDNMVPQLRLLEILIRQGLSDQAIGQMETLKQRFPEFPKEANEYYDKTIELLQIPDTEKALIDFTVFHNYMRVSSPYQAGINSLKGPGTSNAGLPQVTYNGQGSEGALADKSILEVIKFIDVTTEMGLDALPTGNEGQMMTGNNTLFKAADYNGNGSIDLYVGHYEPSVKSYVNYLFDNSPSGFENIAADLNFENIADEKGAEFVDYDNDGFLDLYIYSDKGSTLYKNADKGVFENVTSSSQIKGEGINKALFFDMDQDGDLDLFQGTTKQNLVYRNNGDGSFVEMGAKMNLSVDASTNTIDAAFGDFDDDGDVDLVTVNKTGTVMLFSNNREGMFERVSDAGFGSVQGNGALAVGDCNNDGFLDVMVASDQKGQSVLYINQRNGKFSADQEARTVFDSLEGLKVNDVEFIDFDNDGFLDLVFTGLPDQNVSGLLIVHNNGKGGFSNVPGLVPQNSYQGTQISSMDYDSDGDLDILLALKTGGIKLLRNDGGNLNHYVNMKLVGLRTGSAKNNYFGIGAKVELRAGDMYQSMVVTQPNISFGLGARSKADIIRITWTNGVPQNIWMPDADQALVESQVLKGSCPFLYTWNGEQFEFVKDITWRSALGMPLGIMGGNTQYAFAEASDDYIKIEGSKLKEKNGIYAIQVTSELWETIYMDQIELIAVDHPESTEVYVPEQFSPPPFPDMNLYQIREKIPPVSALDDKGRDVLPMVTTCDDQYVANFKKGKFQGLSEMHALVLDPGDAGSRNNLHLFLRGWIFPTDASINVALSQSDNMQVSPPVIQVINEQGNWQTIQTNIGFPMGKDKTVIVDLEGKYLSNDKRLRIQTNMEIYWDEVFFAEVLDQNKLVSTTMKPDSADLHYRGFSRSFRKGGRYGPHWFDYSTVSSEPKWRDLEGKYTRYGDVLPLLSAPDNKYIISNAGDETSIRFDAGVLPPLKNGWKRDFLIHSVGWVKDGDFNTAEGHQVEPLPFHGMRSYPPSANDSYPEEEGLANYRATYNTRLVNRKGFQNSIKPKTSE